VYCSVYSLEEYRSFKEDQQAARFEELRKMLPDRRNVSNYEINEIAKVAIIHQRYQRTLNLLITIANNPDLLFEKFIQKKGVVDPVENPLYGFSEFMEPKDSLKKLASMKACPPAGVVEKKKEINLAGHAAPLKPGDHSTEKEENLYHCDIYQLCPWCRYRTTSRMYPKLNPLLTPNRKIVVVQFKALVDGLHPDMDYGHDNHKKLMDAWRSKNEYVGGYTITLPEWHALHDYHDKGALPQHSMTLNTYVILITEKSQTVKPFHQCTPSTLQHPNYLTVPTTLEWKANVGGLRAALKFVMQHPLQMLTTKHAPTFPREVETVFNTRSFFEKAPLGEARLSD